MADYLARPSTAPVGAGASRYEITDPGNTNMKVVVRVRPENETELGHASQSVVKVLDEHVLVFDPHPDNAPSFQQPPGARRRPLLGKKRKDLRFAFDRVFDETASQMEIFEHTTKAVIDGVLNGINCSVFAYGATGAGKTYTMLGNSEYPGVMFLTMMELYRRINELKDEKICEVAVSYCEVYNETIQDLLVSSGPLEVRDDSGKLVVSGLSQHQPSTANEILNMLEVGNKNRTQHPTDANATSSRSHAVFQVFVHQKARTAGLSTEVTCAKMCLIDLAGSERATVTTNRGIRMREGANINRSLLALGNCINALADSKGRAVFIPYRDSKLTRLLKDSLGGNCRTVMIANISPSGLSYEDTYNTLKYADRAKQIKTKCVRNVLNVDFHVTKYRQIVQELQKEVEELKAKLEKKSPKRHTFDPSEATRLQGLVQGVYGERARLRKQMAELDASHRETLLRICRKERDLQRVSALTGCESKKAKIASRIDALRQHIGRTDKQRQTLNEYIFSNNESIGRIQSEISTAVGGGSGLRQLMEVTTEARKVEAESAYQWKQTKHLLKYIRNQERDVARTERILGAALDLVKKQHTMLRASNCLTASLHESYESLVRLGEGGKEVAWADMSSDSMQESSFTQSQHTLFESFLIHASPARRPGTAGSNSPSITASIGILTCNTELHQSGQRSFIPGSTPRSSRDVGKSHPLAEKMTLDDLALRPSSPKAGSPTGIAKSRELRRTVSVNSRVPPPSALYDDSSSSSVSTSTCSTYNTRLNTVLNSSLSRSSSAFIKRPLPVPSGAGLSGRADVEPYTLPRVASRSTPVRFAPLNHRPPNSSSDTESAQGPIYETIDFVASSRPFVCSPAPPFSQSSVRSALPTRINPFDDNFVSPLVNKGRPLPKTPIPTYASVTSSPALQSLPPRFNHSGVPVPVPVPPEGSAVQAVLFRPFPSPSSAYVAGSLQRFGSQVSLSSAASTTGIHTSSIAGTTSFAPLSVTATTKVAAASGATNGIAGGLLATSSHSASSEAYHLTSTAATLQNSTRPSSAFRSVSTLPATLPRAATLSSTASHEPVYQLPPPGRRYSSPVAPPLPPPRKSPPRAPQREVKQVEGGNGDCDLNSTFTVSRGVRAMSVGPDINPQAKRSWTGSGKDRCNGQKAGLIRSQTTGSLSMLPVNSPKSLQERPRTTEKGFSGTLRKVPSYLQLTKSAASKRVLRANNKENQSVTGGKLVAKSKRLNSIRTTFSSAPQPVW